MFSTWDYTFKGSGLVLWAELTTFGQVSVYASSQTQLCANIQVNNNYCSLVGLATW